MELNSFIESVKASCVFLEQEGFALRESDPVLNRNFWYEKNTANEGFRITFGWTQYGDEFHVKGLNGLKRFNVVEKELNNLLGGEITDYYTIHKNPSTNYIPSDLPFEATGDNIHFVLRNQNDIIRFTSFVKKFFSQECLPFFSQYEHLGDVYKVYIGLEREKISGLLLNSGNDIFYRELVIKHIFDRDDAARYYKMVVDEFEPLKSNSTFKKILDNFKQLNANLK